MSSPLLVLAAGYIAVAVTGSMLYVVICLVLATTICDASVETIDNGLVNDPDIECAADAINVHFNTKNPFEGKVYIKGHAEEPGCRVGPQNAIDPENANVTGMKEFGISVPFVRCGTNRKRSLNPVGISVSTVVVVTFHPLFLTKIDRAYEIRCFYMAADKTVSIDLGVSDLTTGLVTSNLPMPVCRYEVLDNPTGKPVQYANIGDTVYHKWTCDSETIDIFCILIHSCFVDDGHGSNKAVLLDEQGCAQDRFLLQNLDYPTDLMAGKEAQVFKYADRPQVFFQCQISILLKEGTACNRPKCKAPEKGRKKRQNQWTDQQIDRGTREERPTMDLSADPISVFDISDVPQVPSARLPRPPNWKSYLAALRHHNNNQVVHNGVPYKGSIYGNRETYSEKDADIVCMSTVAFAAIVGITILVALVTVVVTVTLFWRRKRSLPPIPIISDYGYIRR